MWLGHGFHPCFGGIKEDLHVVPGVEPHHIGREGGTEVDIPVRVVPPIGSIRIIGRPRKGQLVFVEHGDHLDGRPSRGHHPTKLGHITHVGGDEHIWGLGVSHQRSPRCRCAVHAPFPMPPGQGVEHDGVSGAFKHTCEAERPCRMRPRMKGVQHPYGQGRGHGLGEMRRSQSAHR